MNLTDLLDKGRQLHPGAGPQELADWLLDQAVSQGTGVLYPAVLNWVIAEERNRVRAAEQQAFTRDNGPGETRDPETVRPFPYVNPAQESMKQLLAERAYVPGHGMVPWGELTAGFHEIRIGYLEERKRRFVSGVNATVARHRAAVAVLAGSGCPDLNAYLTRFGGLPEDLTAP
jgi:hypothetical protein